MFTVIIRIIMSCGQKSSEIASRDMRGKTHNYISHMGSTPKHLPAEYHKNEKKNQNS